MRILKYAGTLVGLMVAATAAPLAAQNAQPREGFFIGFGLGYGSLGVSCTDCSSDREGAPSGYLKLGGAVKQNVLLGIETDGWFKDEAGGSLGMGNLSGSVYWYPMTQSGFYVKGGAGLSSMRADVDGVGSATETAFGVLAGLGYDWRVGKNTSLSPTANWFRGSFEGGSANVLQLGLGATFH